MAYTNGMNAVSEYAQFYNSDNHDRVYDADSMAEWLTPFFVDGIFNGQMQVTANDNMTVSVAPGFAYIDGKVKHFYAPTIINIDLAHAQYQRIDLIVVRRDDAARDFSIEVIKGTPAQNPVAPTLTRNNTIWELQLATITVPVGATRITQSAISDTRMDSSVCGWVAATVEEIDFDQIKAQFDTWYEEFTTRVTERSDTTYDEAVAEFNAWFQRMKDQLSTDAAGNLQLQIDELSSDTEDRLTHLETDVVNSINDLADKTNENDIKILDSLTNALSAVSIHNMVVSNQSDAVITFAFDSEDAFSRKQSGILEMPSAYSGYKSGIWFLNGDARMSKIPASCIKNNSLIVGIPYDGRPFFGGEPSYFYFTPLLSVQYAVFMTRISSASAYTSFTVQKKVGENWVNTSTITNDGDYRVAFTPSAVGNRWIVKTTNSSVTANDRYYVQIRYDTTKPSSATSGTEAYKNTSPDFYPLYNISFDTEIVPLNKVPKKVLIPDTLPPYEKWELSISVNANDSNPTWQRVELGEIVDIVAETQSPALCLRVEANKMTEYAAEQYSYQNLLAGISLGLWYD